MCGLGRKDLGNPAAGCPLLLAEWIDELDTQVGWEMAPESGGQVLEKSSSAADGPAWLSDRRSLLAPALHVLCCRSHRHIHPPPGPPLPSLPNRQSMTSQ